MAVRMSALFAVLVLAGVVTPSARAQLVAVNIAGTVFCDVGNSSDTALLPVFPNATVQLMCGSNVIASAITDIQGQFQILTRLLAVLSGSLAGSCNVAVTTPLATCNANLPGSGLLQAALVFVNSTIPGVLNFITRNFQLVN